MSDRKKILIVEDDENINSMICEYMSDQEINCMSAYSGSEAKLLFRLHSFDLVLLDLMLPGISGEDLLTHIKKDIHSPVIVLTAKDSIDSKVELLNQGADDYICKPFDLKELKARIHVQLRKQNPALLQHKSYQGLFAHDDMRTIEIQGKTQSLTKHEYRILQLLITNPNRAYTKKEIYEYAWEDNYYGDDKTINVHISNLRSKIEKISDHEYIETIWGIGFKMKS